MDGGSVRRNIALKLKEPQASTVTPSSHASSASNDSKVTPVGPAISTSSGGPTAHKAYEKLQWDHSLKLIGRPMPKYPLLHICEQCDLPILIYGRMKHCRHTFCRDCAKKAAGECPKCHEGDQTFEEASMGNMYICTYGGGRYDNKGCGRSYLSQRDLDAHIAYRHKEKSSTTTTTTTTTAIHPHLAGFFPTGSSAINPPGIPNNFPTAVQGLPMPRGGVPMPPLPAIGGFPPQAQPRFVTPTSVNWTRPPPGYQ
jgi:hypothetical protein